MDCMTVKGQKLEEEEVVEEEEMDPDYYNLQSDSSQEVAEVVEMMMLETKTAPLLVQMVGRMVALELYQIVFVLVMLEMGGWK